MSKLLFKDSSFEVRVTKKSILVSVWPYEISTPFCIYRFLYSDDLLSDILYRIEHFLLSLEYLSSADSIFKRKIY